MTNLTKSNHAKYVFLIPRNGQYGIKNLIKPLKHFFNGAFWCIDIQHRDVAKRISQEAGIIYGELELDPGESFDDLRRKNTASFLLENIDKTSLEIDALKASLKVTELDEEALKDKLESLSGCLDEGAQLIDLLSKREIMLNRLKQIEADQRISQINFTPGGIELNQATDLRKKFNDKLEEYRGKKYIGLCQKTLPEIDDKLLGLRKMILLAAAPNCGKTTLTIQLALDILRNHPEACLIYFSLEMSELDIYSRLHCNVAKMTWKRFMLGTSDIHHDVFFTSEELSRMNESSKTIDEFGNRLQIIDTTRAPSIDSARAIAFINEVKSKTGSTRVIVVIDYLQVWPMPDNVSKSDLEADKWRIGELKKIRDAINEDPLIIISEARKPNNGAPEWGSDMSDVMGSARATYTPDAVMLLAQLNAKSLCARILQDKETSIKDEIADAVSTYLSDTSICQLRVPKGRDGMERFTTYLKFYHRESRFEATSIEELRSELGRIIRSASHGAK